MTSKPTPAPEPPKAADKTYADGHPLDQIHYREYKIILRPDRFTSAQSFHEFAKLVRHTAKEAEIGLVGTDQMGEDNQIREVLFYDTPAFDLYNHAYMLRKRTVYRHGWPAEDAELTLKFRHPEADAAVVVDVRPASRAEHRVKFKEELLGLRDKLGGMRSLYSHACELSTPSLVSDRGLVEVASAFPAVRQLGRAAGTIGVVNNLAVEEVLGHLGELDFGHGVTAKADVAIWRNRGTQAPLIGEFSFQCKFERFEELHKKAIKRSEDFFHAVQLAARDWVRLGATKTGVVYGLGSTPVKNRE